MARVPLVSARQRESTADALRRHFLSGRLSVDEFAERVSVALEARDAADLRRSLGGLPPAWRDGDELRRMAAATRCALVVAAVTTLWTLATLVLLIAFVSTVAAHPPTATELVGYPAVWGMVTALAWHARRRARAGV
jgi:hypothetical protein